MRRLLLCLAVTPALAVRVLGAQAAASMDPARFLAPLEWQPLGEPREQALDVVTAVADGAFPYRVCGARAGGGIACVSSRPGRATPQEALDAPGLTGNIAPDPVDAEVAYVGSVVRFDRRNRQAQDVSPTIDASPVSPRAPLVFAPTDARTLYVGGRQLWKTTNGGLAWTAIGPGAAGIPDAQLSASISAIGPSAVDGRVIWTGMTNGRVHVTRDGGVTWRDVTPVTTPRSIVSVETSHFDVATAYLIAGVGDEAASARVLRTRDAGLTWTAIVAGFPSATEIFAVREDAFRRGLLFAATSAGVFLSFDDGDSWRAMNLNLPAVAVRDLVIKESDLVAATAGRGFWLLRDITPLRQITADVGRADAFLFRPAAAWRSASDTGGATLNYHLGAATPDPVSVEIIVTATGEVIRRFSDELPRAQGLHRVAWDLRYASPVADASVPGIAVLPGTYQVRLTVGGRVLRQGIVVRLDPRVRASLADLTAQFALATSVTDSLQRITRALTVVAAAPERAPAGGALEAARHALADVLARIQQSDTRPTPALDAAAAAAVAGADAALAAAQ